MQTGTGNAQSIEVFIIEENGTSRPGELEKAEETIIQRLDHTLQQDASFQATYPGARLVRIDSMRGLKDSDEGRFCLRYQFDGGITEFWGHVADRANVDMKQGIVSAAQD
ncbi:hypothetical protein [Methylocaldum sp.]|uniref:hypothetical protein n=1 Tax=Methylocaldum sp. TaxID=1969727 RepID=UPI002D59B062|nr:hypothetical protein [Methylocaldum sp.]HYE38125.1 hypothetical protein [Methylocaldum sp.]